MPSVNDIKQSVQVNALIKDKFAREGEFIIMPTGDPVMYVGGFTAVFPFTHVGEKWAFRCWHSDLGNIKKRMEIVSAAMNTISLPYFGSFQYVDEGIVVDGKIYPTTRMKWIEGLNLKDYICQHRDSTTLKLLADSFLQLCKDMHRYHIAHGDLQHENIIVSEDGKISLIDYDSMYVPQMKDYNDIIIGKKDYQHPKRKNNVYSSEKLDYFSELIIYTSILGIAEDATLIEEYQIEASEAMLFTSKNFENLKDSGIYKRLYSFGGVFILLLHALENYLSHDDINELVPFISLLEIWSKKPVIRAFEAANNGMVYDGDKVVLTWKTEYAETVELNGVAQPSGCDRLEKQILEDTTYTLVCRNGLYKTEAKVDVKWFTKPQIVFTTSTDKLRQGKHESTTISWEVVDGVSLELLSGTDDAEKVEMKGTRNVMPETDCDYILRVIGLDGERAFEKHLQIRMLPESEIEFVADKLYVLPEVPVVLSWNVKHAKNVTLDGFGAVKNIGMQMVTPTSDTVYKLVVEDDFGNQEKELKVSMLPLPVVKSIMVPTPDIETNINVNTNFTTLQPSCNVQLQRNIHVNMPGNNLLKADFVGLQDLNPYPEWEKLELPALKSSWWRKVTKRTETIKTLINKLKNYGQSTK